MDASEPNSPNGQEGSGTDDEPETILRGEVVYVDIGGVRVTESPIDDHAAQLKINGEESLARLTIDLTRADALALRDDLDDCLTDGETDD